MAGERLLRADILKDKNNLLFTFPSSSGKLALYDEYRYAESLAAASTGSTTVYSSKLTLNTTTALPLGDYLLIAEFKWWLSAGNRAMSIQLLDGATVLKTDEVDSSVGANSRPFKMIMKRITGISGVKNFSLQFKAGSTLITNASTANISDVSLHLWRIS